MRILALSIALLMAGFVVTGCGPLQKPETDDDTPTGPDDPRALKQTMESLVKAAQAGDEAAVLEKLEAHLATREMLVELFGDTKGERVWAGYSDTIAASLRAEAPKTIVQQVKTRGLTEVVVDQVGPAYPANTTPGDQLMLDAMVNKQAMYTVRFRKPGEELGLRLNGFVFLDGRWRSLLKSYDHMAPPPPPEDAAPETPADDAGIP